MPRGSGRGLDGREASRQKQRSPGPWPGEVIAFPRTGRRCSRAHVPCSRRFMMATSVLPDVGIELREGYAEVGDQSLHYVEAGEGPLLVLLHGFPEFWFGWRLQIEPLAAAGFRVVAPDTRGYNLSSKPESFEAYAVYL